MTSETPLGGALTLGAVEHSDGTFHLRVWAPAADEVAVVVRDGIETRTEALRLKEHGYWTLAGLRPGPDARYGYLIDGEGPFPDPCSRRQPEGVHGLSAFVSPSYAWTDGEWERPDAPDLVIYELHAGAATAEGTFGAAEKLLPGLTDLGVNAVELMPVAAFPGKRNWGYDGVDLFAVFEGYGGPEGLRSFVDAAHAAGLAVILDVVYNHFGPDGDYSARYSAFYRHQDKFTAWGPALNFDGPGSAEVRRFVFENALMWLREYHIDGLRLDATHAIIDESHPHLLAELRSIARTFDDEVPYLIAETHENDRRYVLPVSEGGNGFDAVWADDFHHAARRVLQDDFQGHFAGFEGGLGTLAKVVERGWLYSGQMDSGFGARRGTDPDGLPWHCFVFCLENHDQAGNRAFGERLAHTANEGEIRALTMLLLLHPAIPLIFMGQELATPTPFPFFTDHEPSLGELVRAGRRQEFGRFQAFADAGLRDSIPDPQVIETFLSAKPRGTLARDRLARNYFRDLLSVRGQDGVLRAYRGARLPISARVELLGEALLVAFEAPAGRRLIGLNLGRRELPVALPRGEWEVVLNSDEGAYGGFGRSASIGDGVVTLPARAAVFCRDA